ncbi:MAG: type II toxin-antitoxin system VapC family toxin [Acidobacteria bacterium]|nr:type II toxin-antitoxin system VapC family toxin [Acidobacteriota bacterium]
MAAYVTDTHPLVWYAGGEARRLSDPVLRIFRQADEQQILVYVPVVALWEVSMLLRRGRIALKVPFPQWVRRIAQRGYECAALDVSITIEASRLGFTRDPFDAAIVATALHLDLPLITKDSEITDSGVVPVVW